MHRLVQLMEGIGGFCKYKSAIKHLEIGQKSDVTTIAMATMTIQDGG